MFEKILLFFKKISNVNIRHLGVYTLALCHRPRKNALLLYIILGGIYDHLCFVGKVRDKCANLILCHSKGVVLPPVIMTVMLEKSSSIPSKRECLLPISNGSIPFYSISVADAICLIGCLELCFAPSFSNFPQVCRMLCPLGDSFLPPFSYSS